MSLSAEAGPLVVYGQNPNPSTGGPPSDYNADYSPSPVSMGVGLLDPRFGYQIGGTGNGSVQAIAWGPGVNYVVIDQVPSLAAVANIAVGANAVSGTPVTLVSSTGAGITVMTAALNFKVNGNTVPACLAIDGLPALTSFGQSGAIQVWDPTTLLSRAVSITGVSGGSGGAFTVRGYGLYGAPMSEVITAASGAATTNGKKAFKFIASVTPGFADAHNYSVGTTDIYGLPFVASSYGYVNATFNNAPVTSPTFLAGVTTTSTGTSGDTRGTIVVTSDGTKRLQVMQGISVAELAALTSASRSSVFGVTPFTS